MDVKNVIIADDENLFAKGLKQLLEDEGDIKITAIVNSGDKIREELNKNTPDALLLDLNMPGKNGLEILKEIRKEFPDMIIAILSSYTDMEIVEKAERYKANAYLAKFVTVEELREVIFNTHNSKYYVSVEFSNKQRKALQYDHFSKTILITDRENDVLKLIVEGHISKEIAIALNISLSTVKTHRKNLFKKLGINKTSELLKYVYKNKIM